MSVGVIKICGAVKVLHSSATKKGARHALEPRLGLPSPVLPELQQLVLHGLGRRLAARTRCERVEQPGSPEECHCS